MKPRHFTSAQLSALSTVEWLRSSVFCVDLMGGGTPSGSSGTPLVSSQPSLPGWFNARRQSCSELPELPRDVQAAVWSLGLELGSAKLDEFDLYFWPIWVGELVGSLAGD